MPEHSLVRIGMAGLKKLPEIRGCDQVQLSFGNHSFCKCADLADLGTDRGKLKYVCRLQRRKGDNRVCSDDGTITGRLLRICFGAGGNVNRDNWYPTSVDGMNAGFIKRLDRWTKSCAEDCVDDQIEVRQ